ncbi:MAG: hypothetical protein RJA91_688 [Pseudomonadota bacterium]|jgi:hypothetical protein
MSLNDTIKICLVVLILSLSLFTAASTCYLLHKIIHTDKITIDVKGTYLQDQIAESLINTNIVEAE